MNKEIQITHTLKILLAVLATVVVLGGGFIGWLYYSGMLGAKNQNTAGTVPAKRTDANQTEINNIQNEIQKSDDIDISDIDNTSELDKIDLSGI